MALLAYYAGAPTGALGDGAAAAPAATVAGGVTVAQEESVAAIAANKTERSIQKTPKTEDNLRAKAAS